MKRRKVTAILVAASMCFGLAACGSTTGEEGTQSTQKTEEVSSVAESTGGNAGQEVEQVVKMGITDDPGTLAPFASNTGGRLNTLQQVYEKLGIFYEGEMHYVLMKEYTKVEGTEYPTYDITLYEGIYDSEGNPFTAEDVIYCIEKYQSEGANSTANYISSVKQLDDYSVEIALTSNAVAMFETVCSNLYFVTKEAYEASENSMSTAPVGTGPYVVADYESGSMIALEVNPDYWQKDESLRIANEQQTNAPRVEYHIIKEKTQLAVQLKTGALDFVANLGYEASKDFMDGGEYQDKFSIETYESDSVELLYCNNDYNSVFNGNLALRQAVFYAIDAAALVEGAMDGYAVKVNSTGPDLGFSDYQDSWDNEPYFDYDLEYAKKCLEESGYKPGEVTLRILYKSSSATQTAHCQIIQLYLDQIGIGVELCGYESALFESYKLDSTQWDLLCDTCGVSDYFASYWRYKFDGRGYSEEVGNAAFVHDDHFYELVEAAVNVETHSDETMDAFHQYLKEQCYARGLYCVMKFDAANSEKFVNVVHSASQRVCPGACTYVWN